MHKVAIFGSTGSIGTLTLEVISHLGKDYKVVALSTHRNIKLLQRQIEKYSPEILDEELTRHFEVEMEEIRELLSEEIEKHKGKKND